MIQVDFIILMRKNDFADLYKYGYLYVDEQLSVAFEGDVRNLSNNLDVRDKVFSRINQFENTQSYLLVYYQKQNTRFSEIDIREVQGVYALDEEAKRGIFLSFGKKINVQSPIWPIDEILIKNELRKYQRGARNMWEIFDIKEDVKKYEEKFREVIEKVSEIVCTGKKFEGNLPFEVYLLGYQRKGFYPQGNPGYFLDAVNVLTNVAMKKETELPDKVPLYKHMLELESDIRYDKILSNDVKDDLKKLFDTVGEHASDYLKIAFIYFYYKKTLEDNGNQYEKFQHSKRDEIFYKAVYLLGVVKGVDDTHEYLYQKTPLKISCGGNGKAQNTNKILSDSKRQNVANKGMEVTKQMSISYEEISSCQSNEVMTGDVNEAEESFSTTNANNGNGIEESVTGGNDGNKDESVVIEDKNISSDQSSEVTTGDVNEAEESFSTTNANKGNGVEESVTRGNDESVAVEDKNILSDQSNEVMTGNVNGALESSSTGNTSKGNGVEESMVYGNDEFKNGDTAKGKSNMKN